MNSISTPAVHGGSFRKKQKSLVEVWLAVIQQTSADKETRADSGLPHINTATLTDDTLQHLIKASESPPPLTA